MNHARMWRPKANRIAHLPLTRVAQRAEARLHRP